MLRIHAAGDALEHVQLRPDEEDALADHGSRRLNHRIFCRLPQELGGGLRSDRPIDVFRGSRDAAVETRLDGVALGCNRKLFEGHRDLLGVSGGLVQRQGGVDPGLADGLR